MIESPRYRWKLLRAGPIWLDGGGMFGIIPRVVWNRRVPTDDSGRIELAHNCLLLEPVAPPTAATSNRPRHAAAPPPDPRAEHPAASPRRGAGDRILIETGSGDKFDEKHRRIFGLSDRTIITAVEETAVRFQDIAHVIVSHLHFDHAGGLTRRSPAGPTPTFPNAVVHVQQREWEDALANRSTMTRTYLRDHLDPIADNIRPIASPPPFPAGAIPDRNQFPANPLEARETEILPGIFGFLVPGHTWGQQAIRFTDDRDRQIVFTPDVMPTVHHVGWTCNLAYDVEPYVSAMTRQWFLRESANRKWTLLLDHESGNPCCTVRPDGEWFALDAAQI